MKTKKAASHPKRKRGRPNTRGETVQVGFRLSKDLDEAIEQVRRMAVEEMTKTLAFEKVVRAGLEKTLASDPRNRVKRRRSRAR